MKKKMLFLSIIILFPLTIVNADCTKEEVSLLQKDANKIKVTYKHLGKMETENGEISYNNFDLTFKNLNPNMYIKLEEYNIEYHQEESAGNITLRIITGKYKFTVRAENCSEIIDEINVNIPRYNIYSMDPLCEGINGDDFALCGKYYDYNVTYDSFKQRVEHYRKIHKIDEKVSDTPKENITFNTIINKLVDYIKLHYIYLVVGLLTIILIILIVIIIRKKRKRGVLKWKNTS